MSLIASEPVFQGYSDAYPHKTAYRPLPRPVPLQEIWAGERRDALFLYLHVPFCEHRCGFCNLFTQAHPVPGQVQVAALALEQGGAEMLLEELNLAAHGRLGQRQLLAGTREVEQPAGRLEHHEAVRRGQFASQHVHDVSSSSDEIFARLP